MIIPAAAVARLASMAIGLMLWAMAGTAWPHASLLRVEPADGVHLATSPAQIRLDFDEAISPVELRVFDAHGRNRLVALPAVSGNGLSAAVAGLEPGSYWVSWRVVSADSHPVGGAFTFAVGDTTVPNIGAALIPTQLQTSAWEMALTMARAILYLTLLQAAGAALFRALIGQPLRIEALWFPRLIVGCSMLAAAIAMLSVGLKGGQLLAAPWAGLLQPDVWAKGAGTSFGPAMAVVAGASFLMAATRHRVLPCAAFGIMAVAGLCLTGHAASGPRWAQILTFVHGLAATFWLGALYPLLRIVQLDGAHRLAVLQRFSGMAMVVTPVLFVCGFAVAWHRMDLPGDLAATLYGQLLTLKLSAAGILLGLAAINRMLVTPALARGQPLAAEKLLRTIGLELIVAATLLVIAATLANTPPKVPGVSIGAASQENGWQGERLSPSGLALRLAVTPAATGANSLEVDLQGRDGHAFSPISVTAELRHTGLGTATLQRPLTLVKPGQYRLKKVQLPMAGSWDLRIVVLVDEFVQEAFDFGLAVRPVQSE